MPFQWQEFWAVRDKSECLALATVIWCMNKIIIIDKHKFLILQCGVHSNHWYWAVNTMATGISEPVMLIYNSGQLIGWNKSLPPYWNQWSNCKFNKSKFGTLWYKNFYWIRISWGFHSVVDCIHFLPPRRYCLSTDYATLFPLTLTESHNH